MNSLPLSTDVPDLWSQDGSLRDVYFVDTTLEHWKSLLAFVQSNKNQYSFDGDATELPVIEEIFGSRDNHHLLTVVVSDVSINCHFFITDEIELDIDPREVRGNKEHEAVLEFIAALSKAIGKTALITPENGANIPFLSFEPKTHAWAVHG